MQYGKTYEILSDHGFRLLSLYHSAVMPEKRKYREHHHTDMEIALIKQGSGLYRVGDRSYDIRKGDIFLFSADEVHCITEISGEEQMVIMNVHFAPRFVWSKSELFDTKFLKVFFCRSERFENRIDRENPATGRIAELLLEIEKEFEKGESEYELMVKIRLLTVLVELIRNYGYVSASEVPPLPKSDGIEGMERTMDYIDENVTSPLSLSELAKIAGMNRTYFCTVFKRLNGMSPWDYITVKRIDIARRLLLDRKKTVLEVALECGFGSTANFNRAFRKVTGKTPKELR